MSPDHSIMAGNTPEGRDSDYSLSPHLALKRLPKEFRKSIFAEFDRRFIVILVISLIVHVILVNYFYKYVSTHPGPKYYADIQKQYAELLLSDELMQPPARQEATSFLGEIPGPAQWGDLLEGTGVGGEGVGEAPLSAFSPTAETMLPTAEAVTGETRAAAEVRASRRVARAERVRELGLFYIIGSGGSGAVDHEAMERLFSASAENVGQLGTVLSKLDALTIPRYGARGSRGGRVSVSAEDLKGERAGRPEEQIAALVGDVAPLASVIETPVERNERYEKVESSIAEKPTEEELKGMIRTAEDVSRIILSHQSSIQDCYKSALKNDQTIQGEITMRFWVDYEGRVVDAVILSSTVDNQELEECVLRRMRRWNDFGYADPSNGNTVYRQTYQFGY